MPRAAMAEGFDLKSCSWFCGKLPRDEVEKRLKNGHNGEFLVRESKNYQGDFTLSVHYESRVEHYRVKRGKHSYFTIDEEIYFENITKLIEHYREGSYGLCTALKDTKKDTIGQSGELKIAPEMLIKRNCISKKHPGATEVWQGEHLGKQVAFKVFKCSKRDFSNLSSDVLKDSAVLSALRHDNLVSFLGVALKEPYIYLVTEYMPKGSFVMYLRSRGRRYISKQTQADFASQICNGMKHLESNNIFHGNLAAHNVLFGDDGVVKVTDFRVTHFTEEVLLLEPPKTLTRWRAPEVLATKAFSSKADVWSFGVVLWEIYSFGRVPYPGKRQTIKWDGTVQSSLEPQLLCNTELGSVSVVEQVPLFVESGEHMSPPDDCPDKVYCLMRKAWHQTPTQRPTFSELYEELLALNSYDS